MCQVPSLYDRDTMLGIKIEEQVVPALVDQPIPGSECNLSANFVIQSKVMARCQAPPEPCSRTIGSTTGIPL